MPHRHLDTVHEPQLRVATSGCYNMTQLTYFIWDISSDARYDSNTDRQADF
jgi:hypothetical protein